MSKCKCCNSEFEKKGPTQIYCSKECNRKFNLQKRAELKVCQECNKEFSTNYSHVRFCSTSCGSINRHKTAYKFVLCTRCGIEFEFKGTTKPKFCTDCRKKHSSEKVMDSRIRHGIQKETGCGKGGWQTNEDNSVTRNKNGIHQREVVYLQNCLSRFKFKSCVVCESEDNIHVHHIDHNPNNHIEHNLVFLCRECHVRHHTPKSLLTTEHIQYCIERKLLSINPAQNGETLTDYAEGNTVPKDYGDVGTV